VSGFRLPEGLAGFDRSGGLRVSAVLALAAGVAIACGKRGDPLPPLPRTPQAVGGFAVAQRAGVLEVTMVAPRLTTGGERLGVVELELVRVDGPGDIATGRKQIFRAAPGERVVETFPLPPPGTAVKLAARARHRGQVSAAGKTLALTVLPPPPAPPSLTATLQPTGVLLTWSMPVLPSPPPPPATTAAPLAGAAPSPAVPAASPAGPSASPVPSPAATASPAALPAGAPPASPAASTAPAPSPPPPPRVRLYRRAPDGEPALLAPSPLGGTTFEDTAAAPGQAWCYVARLVTSAEPLVESGDSPEVCVEVKDVFPPAAPTGLTALLQGDEVEVSWSPSADADLASYRLYRASAGAAPQRVAEITKDGTSARDAPAPGAVHVYTLTAVDAQGNESAHSAPAEVRAP
jgi:hypothetical protein